MWEITFIDNGKTVYWTKAKCNRHFGKAEFGEISQGYAPHIVAIEVTHAWCYKCGCLTSECNNC